MLWGFDQHRDFKNRIRVCSTVFLHLLKKKNTHLEVFFLLFWKGTKFTAYDYRLLNTEKSMNQKNKKEHLPQSDGAFNHFSQSYSKDEVCTAVMEHGD